MPGVTSLALCRMDLSFCKCLELQFAPDMCRSVVPCRLNACSKSYRCSQPAATLCRILEQPVSLRSFRIKGSPYRAVISAWLLSAWHTSSQHARWSLVLLLQVQRLVAVLSVPSIGRNALLHNGATCLPMNFQEEDMAVLKSAGWTEDNGLRALLNFSGAAMMYSPVLDH